MPIEIDEIVIEVPSSEATPRPSAGAGPAGAGPDWSAALARRLDEQLRIAAERAERVRAD